METTDRVTESGGFLEEVESQASWRDRKAQEYPEDERNQASADALRALAEWITDHGDSAVVRGLDRALDRLYADPLESGDFGAEMNYRLSRYGFHHGEPEAPEIFVGDLVKDSEEHLMLANKVKKSHERKLRRLADQHGYRLTKGRPRFVGSDPGYMLINLETNGADFGSGTFQYEASLDEVEAFLTGAQASA